MNLSTLISLQAGGPGSGRHKLKDLIKQKRVSGNVFYHFTNKENVQGILKNGLKVSYPAYHGGQGPTGAYIYDPAKDSFALHKSKDIKDIESRTYEGGRLVKITLPDNFVLQFDPMVREESGFLYSKETIPAKFIEEWKPKSK